MPAHRPIAVVAVLLLLAPGLAAAPQSRRQDRRAPAAGAAELRPAAGPDVGDPAPGLTLYRLDGTATKLADLWTKGPLLVVLGSLTSPEFREHAPGIGQVVGEGVDAVVLYTVEAYPDGGSGPYGASPQPPADPFPGLKIHAHADLAARREAARLAADKLALAVPVLVDGMDDAGWMAFGRRPNAAFLIDDTGYVVARQDVFDPADMAASAHLLMAERQSPSAKPPARSSGGRP
jgi:hypothetical protein